jgi:hypothetical protein
MSRLDEALETDSGPYKGPPCDVQRMLGLLPPEEGAALIRRLADPNGPPASRIDAKLREIFGIEPKDGALLRHRHMLRREPKPCNCPRPKA